MGRVVHLAVSQKRGTAKRPVECIVLVRNSGVEGDAHAGDWDRQVSILEVERLEAWRSKGMDTPLELLAANILTENAGLGGVRSGDEIKVGGAVIRVSQIGKFYPPGAPWHKEVLSRFGIFGRVVSGGEVKLGDRVFLIPH